MSTTFGNNPSCVSSNDTNVAHHASFLKRAYLKGEDEDDGKQRHNRIFYHQLNTGAFAYAIVLLHTTDNLQVDGVSTEICMLPLDF